MKHSEFRIGTEFRTSSYRKWRCTDVGARTIVCIEIDNREDQTWFEGPPYAVKEIVFDEYDQAGCKNEP